MSREVKEWIGKTDDSRPPPKVRLRVWDKFKGRDYITGRKIQTGEAWELDHIKALINGGENRESNLAPVLKATHKEKTKADVAEKAMINRKRMKHLGIDKPNKKKIQSRGFKQAPTRSRDIWEDLQP
jgi:5-methylcytosine-specific restriction enzyme A